MCAPKLVVANFIVTNKKSALMFRRLQTRFELPMKEGCNYWKTTHIGVGPHLGNVQFMALTLLVPFIYEGNTF